MADNGHDCDLVLEGGGVKGIGLAGAYSVLVERGYETHRIAGTSAGAIVGALIAAGITSDELQTVMREIDYGKFQDKDFLDHLPLVGRGASLLFEKGIYEGEYLRTWLDGLLADIGARTWGSLRIDDPNSSLPPEKNYKLVVMASDVTSGRLVRLPWDYPRYGIEDCDEQLVADAVRCSMSIPFFYEPVKFKGRVDNGNEVTSYMVDGGMLSNFPIEVFDRTDGQRPRWPTFGIKLSARPTGEPRRRDIEGPLDLALAMIATMTSFHDQIHIEDPCTLRRTTFVDTTGVRATDFDIDEQTQTRLFDNGKAAARAFLAEWDWDKYLKECRAS